MTAASVRYWDSIPLSHLAQEREHMKPITIGIIPARGATVDTALGEDLRVIKRVIDETIIHNPPDTGLPKSHI